VIENRRAKHEYFVDNVIECGISLRGNEVKSIRDGKANITQAWAAIHNGQLVLRGMHISKWGASNAFDVDEDRERVLLVHKSELRKLSAQLEQEGATLVPLKVYFNDNGKCKVELGICRGKHLYDKREATKQRDLKREAERDGLL